MDTFGPFNLQTTNLYSTQGDYPDSLAAECPQFKGHSNRKHTGVNCEMRDI